MDEQKSQLELLFNKAENYFNTSIELYKLKIISSTTNLIADLVSYFVFYVLITIGLLFASISLAIYLGYYFCSQSIGFLIVGIMYILIGLIIFQLKNKLISILIRKKIQPYFLQSNTTESI
jgi:hypothetical protein